tara:strand:+ start:3080 stop:3385 length:306 start_codon:yes stop_codon:yes gene_type:complete
MTFIDEVFQPFKDFCHETNKMTHIISDKKVSINGMEHTVTAVDGLDRIDINNKLHYLNVEMDKLKAQQSKLVAMRDMIDYECERREQADNCDNLFEQMFGE